MQMKATALIRIDFLDEKQLTAAFDALSPEAIKLTLSRSRLHLEKIDNSLMLKIEASDTVALRSALNSYLRWIESLKGVILLLEDSK